MYGEYGRINFLPYFFYKPWSAKDEDCVNKLCCRCIGMLKEWVRAQLQ